MSQLEAELAEARDGIAAAEERAAAAIARQRAAKERAEATAELFRRSVQGDAIAAEQLILEHLAHAPPDSHAQGPYPQEQQLGSARDAALTSLRSFEEREQAVARARQEALAAKAPSSLEELGQPPQETDPELSSAGLLQRRHVDVTTRVARTQYSVRLARYCEQLEGRFADGSNGAHTTWWESRRPMVESTVDTPTLATVFPFVAELTDAWVDCRESWPRGRVTMTSRLLMLRLSHSMAAAVHEVLGIRIRRLEIQDLDAACARTLLARCTALTSLDISLDYFGMIRDVHSEHKTGTQYSRRDMLEHTKSDWLRRAGGADTILGAVASSSLRELRAANITWNVQDEPDGTEPKGHFNEEVGAWMLYEDDAYAYDFEGALEPAQLLKRGLSDAGLASLCNLREVLLDGCQCITDGGLVGLCNRSPHLEKLSVARCTGVGDATLHALGVSCARLVDLNVSRELPSIDSSANFGPSLSASGLEALHSCSRLSVLNLDGQVKLRKVEREHGQSAAEVVSALRARGVVVSWREMHASYAFGEQVESEASWDSELEFGN